MNYIRDERALKCLGKTIKALRINQHISQNQLAFEAAISRNQLGRIERGEINTSVSNLVAIARALHIQVQELSVINIFFPVIKIDMTETTQSHTYRISLPSPAQRRLFCRPMVD